MMAKARKKTRSNEMLRTFRQFADDHNKRISADYMLDLIEVESRRIIRETPTPPEPKAIPGERWTMPAAVVEARCALSEVASARNGDIGAAMRAVAHYERMRWHDHGMPDLFAAVGRYVFRWRGHALTIDAPKQRRLLELLTETTAVDSITAITAIWGEHNYIGGELPGTVRKLIRDTNKSLKSANVNWKIRGVKSQIVAEMC